MDKPDKVAQSINSVCLQYIDPRIQNLEVKKRSFEWNGKEIDLVIIHIPPSDHRPHGFIIGCYPLCKTVWRSYQRISYV